jgi:hypothetical protein
MTMPPDEPDLKATPIACTLSSAQYADRLDELGALAHDALVAREPVSGGERLTFTAGDGVEERLREAIAAEAACCSFLSMDLRRNGDELLLTVSGPADAAPIIRELFG